MMSWFCSIEKPCQFSIYVYWLYEDRKDDTPFSHREKHLCHLIFMFLGKSADLKESFKNKETR